MPRQQTFELIPTTLARSTVARPPMTSKAAKKAYQQANRVPRVSRAEQRRRDAEELERHRKEYEKEKAAAKAKAARERKAEKAKAEREERKKRGLPEPSRFVRASQPTISRFVKADSGKRTWQAMEISIEKAKEILPEEEPEPAAKRAAVEDSEDEFGDFPSLSQSGILEKIDSPMVSPIVSVSCFKPLLMMEGEGSHQEPLQPLAERRQLQVSQASADMSTTRPLSTAKKSVKGLDLDKTSTIPDENLPQTLFEPMDSRSHELDPANKGAVRNVELRNPATSSVTSRRPLQLRAVNMPPPPIPRKGGNTLPVQSLPPKPLRAPAPLPPSSMQAFLESHLDDFFPSPTQELREMLEDVEDVPSNIIARELSPDNKEIDHLENLICTQDLVLSSQDILEITTPCRGRAQTMQKNTEKESETPERELLSKEHRRFFEEKEEDLFLAAVHESKVAAQEVEKRMMNETPQQQARTLQRVPSTYTDYGSDGFSGCSQELLALV